MTNAWVSHHSGDSGGGSRTTRWLTPPAVVRALGEFDLDPAGAPGHELANETYLLERGQDGLTLPWRGRVWLNPPYNRAPAAAFLRKLVRHGRGTALIFARTETAIFHETVWGGATAVLFLKGRLTFLDASGTAAAANAGAPSCLVAYGEDDARALSSAVQTGALSGQVIELHREAFVA